MKQEITKADLMTFRRFQKEQTKELTAFNDSIAQYELALQQINRDNNLLLHNIELLETAKVTYQQENGEHNEELIKMLMAFQNTLGNLKLRQDNLWADMQIDMENIMTISENNDTNLNNFIHEFGTRKMKRNLSSIDFYQKQILFSER